MKNRFEDLPIVTAYSRTGKALVGALRGVLRPLHWLKGKAWQRPPQYFHDDPRRYTRLDLLFFAYKYYFKSPMLDDAGGSVESFFKNNLPIFDTKNVKIEQAITLTAAGDLMPYEWIQPQFCKHLWDDIGEDFFNSDITFANLETPICLEDPPSLVPEVMLSDMHFNADENMFSIFNPSEQTPQYFIEKYNKEWSFDILSTANNHSLDRGEQGVYDTIDFLEKKEILPVGTSKSKENRLNFPIIERKGIKVAFIAYTFSMNQLTNPVGKEWLVNHLEVNQPDVDLKPLRDDIFHARTALKADFVVLSLHYGNAYQAYPGAHIVENTKRIFDECGPDVILGGHAHNVQPMARYDFTCALTHERKQGFVIFSMADFVAYDIYNACHLSVYLKLNVVKKFDLKEKKIKTVLSSVKAVPVYACGVYHNENHRDLRLLDAEKWLEKIEKEGKPSFMTDWNVQELRGLMDFYKRKIIFSESNQQ